MTLSAPRSDRVADIAPTADPSAIPKDAAIDLPLPDVTDWRASFWQMKSEKSYLNRRDFLSASLPAAGAILLTPGNFDLRALAEIEQQFTGKQDFDRYDLVVNGAGLAGYFAAISAARRGLKVLIVERRSSPGFDLAARSRLWIGVEGLDRFDQDLVTLFFPEQEKPEISRKGGKGPNASQIGDELMLLSGTIRKGLLRNLLLARVHVLLMTDVCGILTREGGVQGVLLACKHGLYAVNCAQFIDATDHLLFSRNLSGQPLRSTSAGYVFELLRCPAPDRREFSVPAELGLAGNRIVLHPGKNADSHAFIEFEYPVEEADASKIEYQSRLKTAEIGARLSEIDGCFKKAQIHSYALESSVTYSDQPAPKIEVAGFSVLPSPQKDLSCAGILALQKAAGDLAATLETGGTGADPDSLLIAGGKVPAGELSFSDPEEPALSVPLKKCRFDYSRHVKSRRECQVLVGGGGTSGAAAGIAAAEKKASTLVVEYFNDPGGSKTMGGVMGYYHGMKDNPLIRGLEKDSESFAAQSKIDKKTKRKLFLTKRLIDGGGEYVGGAIICDTLFQGRKVEGILICRDGRLERVEAALTVDATGDGDIAFFAGAEFTHGDHRTGKTQNYSQWNIPGGSKPPFNANADYDIIDNTKISELQRGLFLSHYEAFFYDFHPFLTIRESRRIKGLCELTVVDAIEGTHFDDILSVATSDFDPHHVGNSEFTRCGFLLPHSNPLVTEIPYRSIVPKDLDGILISGKAFSQTQSALQFTRMSADLTVLGFLTGELAAHLAKEQIRPADFDIAPFQREWFHSSAIPREFAAKPAGNRLRDQSEISRRVERLARGDEVSLFPCCRLPKELAVPALEKAFREDANDDGRLLTAKALAWFGESLGNDLIAADLGGLFESEQKEGYPEGYLEKYDSIRGREQNVLKGLFWRINQDIALLGMAGNPDNTAAVRRVLERTDSGGEMFSWKDSEYYNGRIDLRLIPFFNRIYNLCFYAERVPHPDLMAGFEKLLGDENISGFVTGEYQRTRWRVYGGELELYIAAALARCGSEKGYRLLASYLGDIHSNFRDYALSELRELTGQDLRSDSRQWEAPLSRLTFPRPARKAVRPIEL